MQNTYCRYDIVRSLYASTCVGASFAHFAYLQPISLPPPSPLYRLGRQDSFSLLYDTRGADLLFKKTKGKKMFVENPSVPFGRLLVSIR